MSYEVLLGCASRNPAPCCWDASRMREAKRANTTLSIIMRPARWVERQRGAAGCGRRRGHAVVARRSATTWRHRRGTGHHDGLSEVTRGWILIQPPGAIELQTRALGSLTAFVGFVDSGPGSSVIPQFRHVDSHLLPDSMPDHKASTISHRSTSSGTASAQQRTARVSVLFVHRGEWSSKFIGLPAAEM